jgi:hypothetical protein
MSICKNKKNPAFYQHEYEFDEISSQAMDFQTIKKSTELNLSIYFAYIQEVHLYPKEELKIKFSVYRLPEKFSHHLKTVLKNDHQNRFPKFIF